MGDRLVLVIYASRHGLACVLPHQGDDSSLAVTPLVLWPRLSGMFEHFTGMNAKDQFKIGGSSHFIL
jgi:hypothetical protein